MKYVAWVYQNHHYKNSLLRNLSIENSCTFVSLFNLDSEKAVYILVKRLWSLLDLSMESLCKYTVKDLSQIHILSTLS